MYPDLSYLFHDLLGTAQDNWLSIFKTFGFLLLLAFLVAARLLKLELLRREKIGQLKPYKATVIPGSGITFWDYLFNGVFGFVIGYKAPYAMANFDQWQQDAGSVLLSSAGWWWTGLLGAAVLLAYYYWQDRKPVANKEPYEVDVYPSSKIGPITMMAAVGGILGAKFFAIIEYLDRFMEDPLAVLLSGDGLAIYGGLLGGAVAVYLYLRRFDIKPIPILDAVAPSLIVAYGVGRIGCQLSGDGDWGIVAAEQPSWWFLPDWMWSFQFPHNVLRRGEPIPGCDLEYCMQLAEGVYPTSVYETLIAFSIGALLWSLRKRLTKWPGILFCIYLVLNGIERFFIEFVRVNDRYDVLGFALSQAQIIAICFMVTGVVAGYFFLQRAKRLPEEAR
ncbi:MAG: prolipoprotein diacylglyceryl transferase family protein [Bacteroidota bacterium]